MKAYIGTKIVQAEPRDREENLEKGTPAEAGYAVVYEDGYRSWSPKDVFERCYRPVTDPEATLVLKGESS